MGFLTASRILYTKEHGFSSICCIPRWIIVWGVPFFTAGFGFMLQNFQLHYATYYYVHEMKQFNLQRGPVSNSSHHPVEPIPLSIGLTPEDVSFGSVNDPVSQMLGYGTANIKFLDFIALFIPVVFVLVSVSLDNAYTYTRAMFCFAVMEVLKGLADWITVVPDSNGWKACKVRLGNSNNGYDIEWYSQEHSFMDLLMSQIHAPMGRFCADMMLSGHTQVVTIFGLGLFETVSLITNAYGTDCGMKWHWKIVCQTAVAALVIGQQALGIYVALKSRFHYSSDMLLALVVSYLVYTGSSMAWLANKWVQQGKTDDKTADIIMDTLKKMPDSVSYCGFRLDMKQYRDKAPIYENRWLRTFRPRMIQLGCCCAPWSQLYLISQDDWNSFLDTVEESNQATKEAMAKAKEKELDLNHPEVIAILKKYEMNTEVKNIFLRTLGLPHEVDSGSDYNSDDESAHLLSEEGSWF